MVAWQAVDAWLQGHDAARERRLGPAVRKVGENRLLEADASGVLNRRPDARTGKPATKQKRRQKRQGDTLLPLEALNARLRPVQPQRWPCWTPAPRLRAGDGEVAVSEIEAWRGRVVAMVSESGRTLTIVETVEGLRVTLPSREGRFQIGQEVEIIARRVGE
jgi:hypothetical protein